MNHGQMQELLKYVNKLQDAYQTYMMYQTMDNYQKFKEVNDIVSFIVKYQMEFIEKENVIKFPPLILN